MPVELCCEGNDAEFNCKLYDLVTFKPNNKDYIIIRRVKVPGSTDVNCCCQYIIYNVDINDPEDIKQVNLCDEECFEPTNILDVFTKLWDNVELKPNELYMWVEKTVPKLSNVDLSIEFKQTDTSFGVILNGVEFTKPKSN